MRDLVRNDDSIIENGFFVRDILGKNTAIVNLLMKYIQNFCSEDIKVYVYNE